MGSLSTFLTIVLAPFPALLLAPFPAVMMDFLRSGHAPPMVARKCGRPVPGTVYKQAGRDSRQGPYSEATRRQGAPVTMAGWD